MQTIFFYCAWQYIDFHLFKILLFFYLRLSYFLSFTRVNIIFSIVYIAFLVLSLMRTWKVCASNVFSV